MCSAGVCRENRVLSHDLLEGAYARSALISDVELVEESPSRYDADVKRRHRWIRGDWQIAAWLMPRVPTTVSEPGRDRPRLVRAANPLSPLSRLKILDNLRRSLVPASLTMLLLLGWSVLAQPGLWTLAVLAALFVPVLLGLVGDLLRKPDPLGWRAQLSAAGAAARRQFTLAAISLATLPYEAWFSLDADRAHAVAPGCLAPRPARVAAVCRRGAAAAHHAPPATSPRRSGAWRSRRRSLSPRLCCSLSGGPKRCPLRGRCCCCGPHRRPSSGGSTSRSHCASRPSTRPRRCTCAC